MKPLLLVNGKPLFQLACDHAKDVWNANELIVVASPKNIEQLYHVSTYNFQTYWVIQPQPLGVVDAIVRGARAARCERLLILCADNLFKTTGYNEFTGLVTNTRFSYLASKELAPSEAERFTKIKRLSDGGCVLSRESNISGKVWLGPLLINKFKVNRAFSHSGNDVEDFIMGVSDNGKNLRDFEMDCSDLGVPEAIKGEK